MIYQHPLAYLLGLEGLALLRGWAGDFDREFVLARLAEVRRLLDEPALMNHPGVDVPRRDSRIGYAAWAPTYDDPENGLFAIDEPAVDAVLEDLPVGEALDAACPRACDDAVRSGCATRRTRCDRRCASRAGVPWFDREGTQPWPWTLFPLVPAAARAAWAIPAIIVWDFERV